MPDAAAGALITPRLVLLPATIASLAAELLSPRALGEVLDADVPESWPPELYDADAVRWTIGWLQANPQAASWCMYYIALAAPLDRGRARLVGICGYKGAPDASGVVEVVYGVLAEERRRGYAREAVRELITRAFADPGVREVVAHTLPELTPSIGVLQTIGFSLDGPGSDPYEPSAIRFVLTRAVYEASLPARSDLTIAPRP